jgi:1-deoxy-D-xylulose-5-phosphate synthase
VVTIEDGVVNGGIGDALSRELRRHGIDRPVRSYGLPREFLAHGSRTEVLDAAGLDPQTLARAVVEASAAAESLLSS